MGGKGGGWKLRCVVFVVLRLALAFDRDPLWVEITVNPPNVKAEGRKSDRFVLGKGKRLLNE